VANVPNIFQMLLVFRTTFSCLIVLFFCSYSSLVQMTSTNYHLFGYGDCYF